MLEAPFSDRIYETFCVDCKYRKKASHTGCPLFVSADAVCVRFEWCSIARKEEYENEVLDNQSVTLWLTRGKSLDDIYKMSKTELRSILTKKHYAQFEEREKSDREQLERKLAEREVEKRFAKETPPKSPKQIQSLNQRKEAAIQEELKKRKMTASIGATIIFLDDVVEQKKSARVVSKSVMDTALDAMKGRFSKIELSHREEEELLDVVEPKVKEMVDDFAAVEPISTKMPEKIKRVFPALQPKEAHNKMHYFNCKKPDGKLVTYKRDPQSKSYQSEIIAFRKYLAKQNIAILSEEVK